MSNVTHMDVSSTRVTWLIHTRDMTQSHVSNDAYVCRGLQQISQNLTRESNDICCTQRIDHSEWGSCNTLQHTATHCNTLQHTATHCNTDKSVVHDEIKKCVSNLQQMRPNLIRVSQYQIEYGWVNIKSNMCESNAIWRIQGNQKCAGACSKCAQI